MLPAMLVSMVCLSSPDGGVAPSELKGRATEEVVNALRVGGAAPSPREVARTSQEWNRPPTPIKGVKFLVLPGPRNRPVEAVAEFTPDDTGAFRVVLGPGTYCVVEASRRLPQQPSSAPAAAKRGLDSLRDGCRARWAGQCDATWQVPATVDLSFTITRTASTGGDCGDSAGSSTRDP